MLNYKEFLTLVIDEAREKIVEDYISSEKYIMEGSLAGLEACRNKAPPELADLLERAYRVHNATFHATDIRRYWRVTCFMHEVAWICNIVSCVLINQGVEPIIQPTMRAARTAERISKTGIAN